MTAPTSSYAEPTAEETEPCQNQRREAALHRAILGSACYAMIITDPQGLITTFNVPAERMFGCTAEAALNKLTPAVEIASECVQLLSPQVAESGWRTLTARARMGATDERLWQCLGREGRRFTIPLSITELRDENGETLGFMIVASEDTARIQAETALRDSEQRFQTFMNNTPACAWIKDAEGRYLYINQTYARMFERNLDDIWGCDDYDLFPPEIAAKVRENDIAVMANGQAVQLTETVPTPDGDSAHWLVCKFPMRDADGGVCIGGVAFDTTASHQAEKSVRELNIALASAVDGIARLDVLGRYVYANDAYARGVGRTPEEMVGMDWALTVHPDDQEFMRAEYARMVAEGRTVSEVRGIRKDGSCFHKEVAMVRLLDADNLFLGHFCFMKDISVRKAALAALEESETRFRAAIEAMQEGFVIQDANGAIYLNNHSAEAILGLSADQLNGRTSFDPCWRAIHEDGSDFPGEQHPAIRALRDGVALHNVIMGIERPTGETVWVSINAAPLYRPKEWKPYSAVATFADVTAQRQTQEQIDTYIVSVNDMCGALEAQKAALEQQKTDLEALATTDGLTGLRNHRAFQERLGEEFQRAARYHLPLSVVLLDVDKFKSYNDTFGHPAGDRVLKQVAQILQETARNTDFVARYGGEEFVILLPETDSQGALEAAERFRAAIEETNWPGRNVTASFGIATLDFSIADSAALLAAADRALYFAKHSGRNRVCHFREVLAADAEATENGLALSLTLATANETELQLAYDATIEGWSQMLDMRDTETEGHTRRVTETALRLAARLGLGETERVYVRWGAQLHDIGKMGVPDRILLKPGALTEEEWKVMRRHPTLAYEMLSPIGFLRSALDIPLCHHEKWDGTGYPRGLKGEEIPFAARLFAVVDVWDALRSDRPYRGGWPEPKVRHYLAEQAGTHFDPMIVEAFLELLAAEPCEALAA